MYISLLPFTCYLLDNDHQHQSDFNETRLLVICYAFCRFYLMLLSTQGCLIKNNVTISSSRWCAAICVVKVKPDSLMNTIEIVAVSREVEYRRSLEMI
jgi:hypothetical protein